MICWLLGAILVAILINPVQGQTPTEPVVEKPPSHPPTAQTHPNNPELWNTEQMMEDAVLQISRRYNLNQDQEDYTRHLLVNRVTAFLEKYEPEVRELLKESIDLRAGKKAGTPQAYASWAIRAAPLYAEAQRAILEGNQEWRDILTDEQKKTHDADLSQMRSNFQNVDRLLEGWKEGKGNAMLAQANPRVQSGSNATTQQGQVSEAQPPIVQRQPEDNWLAYVNKFIQTFKLDDKQSISARDKIYKDLRDEVVRYREKNKDEFALLDSEAKSANPKLKPRELEQRRGELEKPIQEKFVLLDSRLRQLVDRKQLAEADPEKKRDLESMFKMLSGQGGMKMLKTDLTPPARPVPSADIKGKVPAGGKTGPSASPPPPPTTQSVPAPGTAKQ
ncbi:MAG TPA: hypothetical protein VJZ71_19090 [Phycisphaerae bacterium]|nr:hypothetical protein [Phycisphaerae bacterium]